MAAETIVNQVATDLYSLKYNDDDLNFAQTNPAAFSDLKVGLVTLGATADNGDTVAINLYTQYGITRFLGIWGWRHTTDNSVIVTENPTTSVQLNTLTATIPGATANKSRAYLIFGI